MTPLTKDLMDIASPVTETPATQAPKPTSSASRSDAVSLEIPVRVHGSRINDAGRGAAPQSEPFEEQTTTMIVFAQGGVLKMTSSVAAGQMMVLTNLKTRQDVICRVLKVRMNPNMQAYVEIEFTHAQPGYWGVSFASDGPMPSAKASTPAPVSTPAPAPRAVPQVVAQAPVASEPVVEAAPTPAYVPPPRPESAFASIGTKEEIQISATPISQSRAIREERLPEPPKKITPAVSSAPSAEATRVSMRDLQGDTSSASTIPSAASSERNLETLEFEETPPAAKSASAMIATAAPAPARDLFGASLGVSSSRITHDEGRSTNWMMIGGIAAGVLLIVGGGAMYLSN